MDSIEVILPGYDGWGVFFWLFGILPVVFLLLGLFLRNFRSLDGISDVRWFFSWLCFFFILVGPLIAWGTGLSLSYVHDNEVREQALQEAGFAPFELRDTDENVKSDFVGSLDGQYIVGSFVQVEGEKWLIIGGAQ